MGIEYAIVYDVIVAAVVVGMVFAGAKKGFAGVVVGLAAVIIAFFCASAFCGPVSQEIYRAAVEEPLENAVSDSLDSAMSEASLNGLSQIDYNKVVIAGVPAGDIQLDYAGTAKAVVELSELDLSQTGIENADLSLFGIAPDTDFSSVNGKTAEFRMSDVEKYGLGKLAVAQYLAVSVQGTAFIDEFGEYLSAVLSALPSFPAEAAGVFEMSGVTLMRSVVLAMTDAPTSVKEAVVEGMIRPYFIGAVQTVAFILIFAVVSAILGIIASALQFVNKIPVLGKVNAFVGAVLGLCEGLITVFVICAAVKLIVSLSGGNIMFFNEMTINSTYIFGSFYNFDFLSLSA